MNDSHTPADSFCEAAHDYVLGRHDAEFCALNGGERELFKRLIEAHRAWCDWLDESEID